MNFKEFFLSVKETAQYNTHNSVIYPALGLAGETGEVVDVVKKAIRYQKKDEAFSLIQIDKKGNRDRTEDIKLELGDVMWYWCNLTIDLGFNPEEILQMNYDKLHKRYDVPTKEVI